MRNTILLTLVAALILLTLVGCMPRKQPDPSDYADREPLMPFSIFMRVTGGFQMNEIRYKEWTIEYKGDGDILYEYLSENELGHIDHEEVNLPAWRGYPLWDVLEANNIWELYSDSSVEIRNKSTYEIEVSYGDRSNDFKVYAPKYCSDKSYIHVVEAILEFY
jgi:hypothetical protein